MPRVQAGQMPITDDDLAYARRLLHDLPAPVRDVAISWYPMAHDMIRLWALETGFSVAQCAGVLAVYSQNTAWHVNVAYAKQALYEGRIVGMRRVTANVRAILAGEPICQHLTEGLKIQSFYHNLMLDEGAVTCDRWIFRAFTKPQGRAWYEWVSRALRLLAAEQGLLPYEVQSMVWLAVIMNANSSIDRYRPVPERRGNHAAA